MTYLHGKIANGGDGRKTDCQSQHLPPREAVPHPLWRYHLAYTTMSNNKDPRKKKFNNYLNLTELERGDKDREDFSQKNLIVLKDETTTSY